MNKPVAYRWQWDDGLEWHYADYFTDRDYFKLEPLYTHPVKQLTKEEVRKVWLSLPYDPDNAPYIFADALLRKAQEK